MANQLSIIGNDYTSDQADIERRRAYAQLLQKQAFQPIDTNQMAGGRVIAVNPLQGISKVAMAYLGAKGEKDASDETKALSTKRNQALADTLKQYGAAFQGAPAQMAPSMALQPNPNGTPQQVEASPTQIPDRNKALAILLQNPDTAPMALQAQLKNLEPSKYDTTPRYDQKGNAFVLNERGEMKNLTGVQSRDKLENVNGVWANPYTAKTEGVAPQDLNKPFYYGPDGKAAANSPYQQFELNKSRAGASNVSVNTATKPFLSEIGKGAGEAVNQGFTNAKSAVNTLNNVQQIREGLDKAIVGPGAGARIGLNQIGEMLGVTGKDTAEQLQNTRSVIQGLARQELAAAGQMKGQGQITESERGILKRAESGEISSLTKPEINTLLGALDKTARFTIGTHQQNVSRLKGDPNAAGIVDYMNVDMPKSTQAAPSGLPTATGPNGQRLQLKDGQWQPL